MTNYVFPRVRMKDWKYEKYKKIIRAYNEQNPYIDNVSVSKLLRKGLEEFCEEHKNLIDENA